MALTDRSGLFDPASPFGAEDQFDSAGRYKARPGSGGGGGMRPHTFAQSTRAAMTGRGLGTAAMYFNRTGGYHPQMRAGQSQNRNLAVTRRQRGGGFGGGMGGMGGGMGGMGMGGMGMGMGPR
jgi:hypothetical protein